MSDIKLNTWTWGVVPKLHPWAALLAGGTKQEYPMDHPGAVFYGNLPGKRDPRWYAVLSLGPPEMPAEELRLPEGWKVINDSVADSGCHTISVGKDKWKGFYRDFHRFHRGTRAECVREINRLLEGK